MKMGTSLNILKLNNLFVFKISLIHVENLKCRRVILDEPINNDLKAKDYKPPGDYDLHTYS